MSDLHFTCANCYGHGVVLESSGARAKCRVCGGTGQLEMSDTDTKDCLRRRLELAEAERVTTVQDYILCVAWLGNILGLTGEGSIDDVITKAKEVVAERDRLQGENAELHNAINSAGLRTCDIAACNCGGLHEGTSVLMTREARAFRKAAKTTEEGKE